MNLGKSTPSRLFFSGSSLVLSAVALLSFSSSALAKTIYVSPSGSNSNTGLTSSAPVRTIQKGYDLAVAGDTIQLSAGDHTERSEPATQNSSDPTLNPGVTWPLALCFAYPKTGLSKSNPITITGTTSSPWTYVKTGPANVLSAFFIRASGITIKNLRIEGSQDLMKLDRGLQIAQRQANATSEEGRILGQCGIIITGVNPQNNSAIPVTGGNLTPTGTKIQYTDISKCSKAAVMVYFDADDITLLGNTISNNTRRNLGGSSAINFWRVRSANADTGNRIIIDRNTVFNNANELPMRIDNDNRDGKMTDGNGIIIDECSPSWTDYKGGFLIKNNLFFANGGSGVCVTKSNNVDIFHNTLYRNVQTPQLQDGGTYNGVPSIGWFGELSTGVSSTGCVVKNNIIYGDSKAKSFVLMGADGSNTFSNNIYYKEGKAAGVDLYNENGTRYGTNQNPQFIAPSMVWGANFKLNIDTSNGKTLSPAVNAGTSGTGVTIDFDGVSRPIGGAPDAGAYESAYVPLAASGAAS